MTPTPTPASVDRFMSLLRTHENRISETFGVLQSPKIPSEEVRACIDASSAARNAVIAEVERLAAQAAPTERDVQDAARYRWLRAEHVNVSPMAAVCWKRNYDRNSSEWVNTASPQSLDSGIDAAMAKD